MEKDRRLPIRAVIFDMDGTVFDTERLYYRFWHELSKERGFHINDDMLNRMRGAALSHSAKIFEAANPGRSYMEERVFRMERVLSYVDQFGVPKKKGLDELMNFLRKEGYRIALGTSTLREQADRFLRSVQMENSFDFIGTGDLVTHGKPEPDLFLLCAERLGKRPEECLVVEDSTNGIRAGHSAGGYVVGIPDMSPLDSVRALCDAQLSDLSEVIPWLAEHRKRCQSS